MGRRHRHEEHHNAPKRRPIGRRISGLLRQPRDLRLRSDGSRGSAEELLVYTADGVQVAAEEVIPEEMVLAVRKPASSMLLRHEGEQLRHRVRHVSGRQSFLHRDRRVYKQQKHVPWCDTSRVSHTLDRGPWDDTRDSLRQQTRQTRQTNLLTRTSPPQTAWPRAQCPPRPRSPHRRGECRRRGGEPPPRGSRGCARAGRGSVRCPARCARVGS